MRKTALKFATLAKKSPQLFPHGIPATSPADLPSVTLLARRAFAFQHCHLDSRRSGGPLLLTSCVVAGGFTLTVSFVIAPAPIRPLNHAAGITSRPTQGLHTGIQRPLRRSAGCPLNQRTRPHKSRHS